MSLLAPIRRRVSSDRRRYKDEQLELDLTYITKNVLAMSVPGSGIELIWRNPINNVVKLLESEHPQSFMIFNVSELTYNYNKFNNQIVEFGFPDHTAPPLDLLFNAVNAIDAWLRAAPDHIAVVHCKGGKGRTGVVVTSTMFYRGLFPRILDAEAYFAQRRSVTGQGVTQPSQRRYLGYFETLLLAKNTKSLDDFHCKRILKQIIFKNVTKNETQNCNIEIYSYPAKSPLSMKLLFSTDSVENVSVNQSKYVHCSIDVENDILIRGLSRKKKVLFQCVFHTGFVLEDEITFYRSDIDSPNPKIPSLFYLKLVFSPNRVSLGQNPLWVALYTKYRQPGHKVSAEQELVTAEFNQLENWNVTAVKASAVTYMKENREFVFCLCLFIIMVLYIFVTNEE